MVIRHFITSFLAHFSPLSLTKHVLPDTKSVLSFHQHPPKTQPWVDAHLVELTEEDFAA